ncbi:DUF4260 domain-containing protein [Methylocapsa palsarum]|uniref:DUF4260 domain-containing protein n=1 Tax=Methylocapsa palsarum TaxID=1612308 RepID=A0A1I3YRM7_9HYPH|nr:DUF4260 domain-containing protein [Methylocapsa palsarum]SFK34410.1 protein of unknown function [Methylocapsa palsarum]
MLDVPVSHTLGAGQTGEVQGSPRILLRLEGLAVLAAAALAYKAAGASWTFFALLFFAPDLSFAGYLVDPRIGAATYNSVHTYIAPIGLGLAALAFAWPTIWLLSLIWAAHIGFDRSLGYGLKYPTAFGDTHLGAIGPRDKMKTL